MIWDVVELARSHLDRFIEHGLQIEPVKRIDAEVWLREYLLNVEGILT